MDGVEYSTQLVSDASFDALKLRRLVKGVDDCKRLLKSSREKALTAEGSGTENVAIGSGSSLSKAAPSKDDVLAVVRKQMTMGLSQNLFSALRMFRNTSGIL